ncbi:MAG: endolytic transglycosylase MltG [Patescibacteria group bacterium]
MSLQNKIATLFFVLLIGLPIVGLWAVRYSRPAPKPLKPREEITITIIPGWNLRDVANYLVKVGLASSTGEVFKITGEPAVQGVVSLEGLLAPETYRVYKNASLQEVIKKLTDQRLKEFKAVTSTEFDQNEILTLASLLEKEAQTTNDRKLVADVLRRRLKGGWALQLDSTVHYAIDKSGNPYTTDKERNINSLWNTYKYAGLPPGPICNPGLDSIEAALSPTLNEYWFFLSGTDGTMHYAKTLEEHTANRYKYLR